MGRRGERPQKKAASCDNEHTKGLAEMSRTEGQVANGPRYPASPPSGAKPPGKGTLRPRETVRKKKTETAFDLWGFAGDAVSEFSLPRSFIRGKETLGVLFQADSQMSSRQDNFFFCLRWDTVTVTNVCVATLLAHPSSSGRFSVCPRMNVWSTSMVVAVCRSLKTSDLPLRNGGHKRRARVVTGTIDCGGRVRTTMVMAMGGQAMGGQAMDGEPRIGIQSGGRSHAFSKPQSGVRRPSETGHQF